VIQPALPASGGWAPGDPVGRRQFARLFTREPLALETGARLGPIDVAYETWGELAPARDNAILVLHALTGDSHAAGPPEPGHVGTGWWDGLIGPGRAIDTRRWFVVCPNVLGGCQGTTGPASAASDGRPYGSRFPRITVRDQVALEVALAEHLAIAHWAAVVGGSMGGMRAIEWAVARPAQVARAIVIAVGAAATAEQIALSSVQNQVIELDPGFAGGDYYDRPDGEGPWRGLALARAMGQISYRTEAEFAERFDRDPQADEQPLAGGRYAIESYLEYHGRHLGRRFDANSYVVFSRAMNHHDVGRDRGGVADALARVTADTTIVGIDSDRLYPLRLQLELAELIPTVERFETISSLYGHDGFLLETDHLGKIIGAALA
jgi:homoserine O-acetyltransferase